jgi:hypothetical protein
VKVRAGLIWHRTGLSVGLLGRGKLILGFVMGGEFLDYQFIKKDFVLWSYLVTFKQFCLPPLSKKKF